LPARFTNQIGEYRDSIDIDQIDLQKPMPFSLFKFTVVVTISIEFVVPPSLCWTIDRSELPRLN
jgi:hypothetical protein